jgi:phosphate transport system protein
VTLGSGGGELRRSFHDDLAGLRSRVELMAGVVVRGIGDVTDALLDVDAAAAARVIAADARIDELYPSVETDVFQLVATQAPVARDLRFLMATLRVAMEVERSGDLVASVGRRVPALDPASLTPAVRVLIADMGARATQMFRTAAGAYASLDAASARRLPAEDDAMDELHRRLLRELVGAPPGHVGSTVELGLIARFYERVADHAVVIGERVGFVVDGSMNPADADEQGWLR